MPHLMVNLDDQADCRKAMAILSRRVEKQCGPGRKGGRGGDESRAGKGGQGENVAALPLPKKLRRIQNRGMWKHLLKIAESAEQPLSLPELDQLLGLPKNKMRSLKAIMAKLENRFELQFLKVDPEAGEDASGNPRYVMVPRIRNHILRLGAKE